MQAEQQQSYAGQQGRTAGQPQERAGGIRKSPQCSSADSQADAEVAAGLLARQMVVLLDLLLGDLIGVAPAARQEAGGMGGRRFAGRQAAVQSGKRRRGRARGYPTRSWARSSPPISDSDGGANSSGSGAGQGGRQPGCAPAPSGPGSPCKRLSPFSSLLLLHLHGHLSLLFSAPFWGRPVGLPAGLRTPQWDAGC